MGLEAACPGKEEDTNCPVVETMGARSMATDQMASGRATVTHCPLPTNGYMDPSMSARMGGEKGGRV